MAIFYSPKTNGFYDEALHGSRFVEAPLTARERKAGKRPAMIANADCKLPDDAIEISSAQHASLLEQQSAGKQIVAWAGKPIAVDRMVDEKDRVTLRRRERDRRLSACDWTQMPDSPLDDGGRATWASYRQALRDLDMTACDWPIEPGAEEL